MSGGCPGTSEVEPLAEQIMRHSNSAPTAGRSVGSTDSLFSGPSHPWVALLRETEWQMSLGRAG